MHSHTFADHGAHWPGVSPGLVDDRQLLAPHLFERLEGLEGVVCVDRGVDRREVARLAHNAAAVADLEDQAVGETDRVDVLERAGLPRPRVVHHRVGHPRDEIPADTHALELAQVRLDIPRAHPRA